MISFRYDAPEYGAAEIAAMLSEIVGKREIALDAYSLGGEVSRFEAEIAGVLGKEKAVFMPTGTLANHLAIRALAAKGSRVIVQERSHIYQDVGDALSTLSGFQLIPLGHHRAQFTLEEAKEALADAAETRVRTGIGAMSIESPVRRCHGEVFDFGEMSRLTAWARENGIGTHLDGARLFIASQYTKIPVREYAALFDTVYVSLYKYFGPPSGAVLAGPAALLDGMFHERRMFGGGLNQAWPFAALAVDGLARFAEEFAEAARISEILIDTLVDSGGFAVSRVLNGSNIFGLELTERKADAGKFAAALRKRDIFLPDASSGRFYLKVNTSLCGWTAEHIAAEFLSAATKASSDA
ncbi:MAG: beta-eliminating lyase-related protein [Treponemataceae bacterium]